MQDKFEMLLDELEQENSCQLDEYIAYEKLIHLMIKVNHNYDKEISLNISKKSK